MPGIKVTCSWPGCGNSFSNNGSLKRHIKTVHKKENKHLCSDCGASFRSAYDLKRHSLSVHVKGRNFKCNECFKAFNTSEAVRVHERYIHGIKIKTTHNTIRYEKPFYECADCGHRCVRKGDLIRHISRRHFDKEYFECHACGCRYFSKSYLQKHIFSKKCGQVDLKRSHLRCIICKQSFQYVYQIEKHYQELHDVALIIEKLKFPTMQDFFNWKRNTEVSTSTKFNLREKTRWRLTYACHRSGPIRIKSSGRKRAYIVRGSKKLDGMCPASLKVQLKKTDFSCEVTFVQTHVGHPINDKSELKFCIPRRQLRKLENQSKICTDLLYDFVNTNAARNDQSTNKDLCNVEKDLNVIFFENLIRQKQRDNFKNVEEFMKMHEKCVLLYKRQGQKIQSEYEDIDVQDEDVILIFMCPTQRKMLEKHSNIMCMDGSCETNPAGFSFYTLIVLDYDGEGFPAAFVMSNRKDEVLMEVFSRCMKMNVGAIVPNVMITDLDESYLNGWKKEIGPPKLILHCMWYVWESWRKHLPKTNNEKSDEENILRENVERDLYSLSVETCIETFHNKLNEFLTPCDDPEINSFLEYFRTEYCGDDKYMLWAYSYRLNSGLNTNTHLESFHRTLRYVNERSPKMKDLYSGLQLILELVIKKVNSFLKKTIHGKVTSQVTALRKAHKEFDEFQKNQKIIVIQVSLEEWRVQSFKGTNDLCVEMYTIRKIRQTCPAEKDLDIGACYLMCNECGDCAHKYSCSCFESAIQSHMCKHIHTVLSYENIEIVNDFYESFLISNSTDLQPFVVDLNLDSVQSIKDEHSPSPTEYIDTEQEINEVYIKMNNISREKTMERLQMLTQSLEHRSEEEIIVINRYLDNLEDALFF